MNELKVDPPKLTSAGEVPRGECFELTSAPKRVVWMRLSRQAERKLKKVAGQVWAVSLESGNLCGFEPAARVAHLAVFYAPAR